jgi:hypothetical protein
VFKWATENTLPSGLNDVVSLSHPPKIQQCPHLHSSQTKKCFGSAPVATGEYALNQVKRARVIAMLEQFNGALP